MANTKVKAEQLEAAQTSITSLGTLTSLTVDDITINGSTISDAADLTIDVGGDINLDAAGGDIYLKKAGTSFLQFYPEGSSHVVINSPVSDKDMLFIGNDGGSTITALTLDMSDAGTATFNHDIIMNTGGTIRNTSGQELQIGAMVGDGSNTIIKSAGDTIFQYYNGSAWVENVRFDDGNVIAGPFGGNGTVTIAGSSSPGYTNQPGTNLLLKSGDGSGTGSSYLALFTSPAGSSGTGVNTAVERMRIDSTGRVGIGAAPAYGKLDIRQTGTGAQDRGLYLEVSPSSSGSNYNAALVSVGNANMTGTVFRIHHESPAANQKLLSLDTTGSNTEKFWVDEDGDAYFAGTVTKPNSPVASYGHATNTEAGCYNYNFGGTGVQSVTCKPTSAVINVGSHFNTSTGKFTCPVAGIYKCEIHGNFYTHYIGDGNFYRFSLRKNSTTHKYHYHTNEANSSSWFYHSYIDIISCAANDTLYWNLDTNNVTVAQGGFGWDAVAWATYDFYLIQ